MSSRMIRELKGLAPWTWDRVHEEEVGPASLRDFEKVWPGFKHATAYDSCPEPLPI
jgi:hypothetical protein